MCLPFSSRSNYFFVMFYDISLINFLITSIFLIYIIFIQYIILDLTVPMILLIKNTATVTYTFVFYYIEQCKIHCLLWNCLIVS